MINMDAIMRVVLRESESWYQANLTLSQYINTCELENL